MPVSAPAVAAAPADAFPDGWAPHASRSAEADSTLAPARTVLSRVRRPEEAGPEVDGMLKHLPDVYWNRPIGMPQ
ncbi:hypothetical protein Shyhy01_06680 [Streptomyces hygroscopicus subsp. hygroscopicus]|nr:hypothetical protein Shyhy01_06680 [Streptomyces hygroscopicus subsp. hygroscopicus]